MVRFFAELNHPTTVVILDAVAFFASYAFVATAPDKWWRAKGLVAFLVLLPSWILPFMGMTMPVLFPKAQ